MSDAAPWKLEHLAAKIDNKILWEASGLVPGVRTCKASLNSYLAYLKYQRDESPHYIFDSEFGEKAPFMLSEFDTSELDKLIAGDFLSALGKKRPPYRWFVAGPAKTGAPWHVDPNSTSAWNALVSGRKRWALYPPGYAPPGTRVALDDDGEIEDIETPTSLQWYLDVYPELTYEQRPLEFVQKPGDIVFIPSGWYHMVLNLEDTISVTQNFVNRWNVRESMLDLVTNQLSHGAVYELEMKLGRDDPELRSFLRVQLSSFFELGALCDNGVVASFKDKELWLPKIQRVLHHHHLQTKDEKLSDADVKTCTARANPIFQAHSWVIKFFSPLSNWDARLRGFHCKFTNARMRRPHTMILAVRPNPMYTQESFSAFHIEATLLRKAGFSWMPKLVASGYFFDPLRSSERWAWPYIVLEVRKGVPLASLRRRQLSARARLSFATSLLNTAKWLGDVVARLHSTTNVPHLETVLPRNGTTAADWYAQYLEYQRVSSVPTHWRRGILSKRLLKQLNTYLDSNGGMTELWTRHPVVLHGDLQEENILVETIPTGQALAAWLQSYPFVTAHFVEECCAHEISWETFVHLSSEEFKALGLPKIGHQVQLREAAKQLVADGGEFSSFYPTTVLDFADAKVGCPLYDLVALHISTFRCNKLVLREFLKCYARTSKVDLLASPGFARRAMKLTLLHPCDTIRPIFQFVPEAREATSLEELEQIIWGV